MKYHHFDPAKIEAANALIRKQLAESMHAPGGEGISSRLGHDMMPVFNLAFAREFGMAPSAADFAAGLAHVISMMLTQFVVAFAQSKELREFGIEYLLDEIEENCFRALSVDQKEITIATVHAEKSGSA